MVWVAGAATLMVVLDLGRRILATNDEARFPLVAQDILSGGAWYFPQLNGVVYFDRRVVALKTDSDLRRVMSQHPPGSAVLTESALAQVADRGGLRVLPVQRLASDPVVLVTRGPAAAPAAVRP